MFAYHQRCFVAFTWYESSSVRIAHEHNLPHAPDANEFTHLPLDKMAAILQTVFSYAFSWMKNFVFCLKFNWSLFPRFQLTITQHWFSKWLGAEKATSHYLNQCWPDSLTHICGTRGRWTKQLKWAEPGWSLESKNPSVTHGFPPQRASKVESVLMSWHLDDVHMPYPGQVLDLSPTNERRRYFVTMSLIGWAQT